MVRKHAFHWRYDTADELELLMAELARLCPEDAVLSEEGADTEPAKGETGSPLRLAVSRSRPPEFVTRLAGGQYEWDSAAPVAVARAHGLHTSRVDGSLLVYNNEDPYLPDLVVCRPEVAEEVLSAIREVDR